MTQYDYKVVPAPAKGSKAKGIKTAEGRFAHSVEAVLNQMASEGWEYQRAELLPSEERAGLTGSTTKWRNVLIFRKKIAVVGEPAPQVMAAPAEPAMAEPERHEPPLHSPEQQQATDNVVDLQDAQIAEEPPSRLTGIELEDQQADEPGPDTPRQPPSL